MGTGDFFYKCCHQIEIFIPLLGKCRMEKNINVLWDKPVSESLIVSGGCNISLVFGVAKANM